MEQTVRGWHRRLVFRFDLLFPAADPVPMQLQQITAVFMQSWAFFLIIRICLGQEFPYSTSVCLPPRSLRGCCEPTSSSYSLASFEEDPGEGHKCQGQKC